MKTLNREAEVYEAVKMGLLRIDPDGSIWKVAEMRGNRWNSRASLRQVQPRRAEHLAGQYLQVRWMTGATRIHCLAHRLVWHHFNGPLPESTVVNHLNGDKLDNRPINLQLTTPSENKKHSFRIGTSDEHGQKNPASVLTDSQVAAIRVMYASGVKTQKQIADQFGVAHQTISKIVRGDRRKRQSALEIQRLSKALESLQRVRRSAKV